MIVRRMTLLWGQRARWRSRDVARIAGGRRREQRTGTAGGSASSAAIVVGRLTERMRNGTPSVSL